MHPQKLRVYSGIAIFCIALGLIVLAVLPFGLFKGFFDSLMPDKDFESLQAGNALVFRVLIILAGLCFLALASYLTGKWHLDGSRFRMDFSSLGRFLSLDRDEKWFGLALLSLTLWGAALRLVYLNAPVTHDEAYTATVFSPSLWYAVTNYHAPNNHVLHTVLVHFSTALLGFHPWAVRLPAFLAGALIIPATYLLGKTLYDRYTALLAATLVAWWPVQVAYSTMARGYSLAALLALVVLWLGLIVRREKNLAGWVLIVLLSALGFYAVPVMFYPFGLLFLWLFLENLFDTPGQGYRSKSEFLIYWLVAGLAAALLTLIFYSPILIYGGMKFFKINQPNPFDQLGILFLNNLRGMYFEWTGDVPGYLAFILGVGILLSLVFHRRLSWVRVPLQAAAILWIGFILVVQRPNAWTRIWFPLAALFMIWASAGLAGLFKGFRLKRLGGVSTATVMIVVVIVGVLLAGLQQLKTLPQTWAHKGRDELAVLFLKETLTDQDIVVAPSPEDAPLWYYSRLYGLPTRLFSRTTLFARAYVVTVPALGQYRDTIISDFGLTDVVDMESVQLIKEINGMNIYEAVHK